MILGIPIAHGNTAKIYHHDNQIIKVFHEHLPKEEARHEAIKQEFAYTSGLPVPRVVDITEVQGRQAIIMEQIQGKTLGELLLKNRDDVEYYLTLSVDVQQKIHQIEAVSFTPMKAKLKSKILSAQRLTDKQKQKLLDQLDQMAFDNKLCHGDFHLFNLILSGEKVYIIDWVDSSSGNRFADVCRTYLLYTLHFNEIAEHYLTLYCEKSGLTRNEVLEWEPIIAGARMAEIVATENPDSLLAIIRRHTD